MDEELHVTPVSEALREAVERYREVLGGYQPTNDQRPETVQSHEAAMAGEELADAVERYLRGER
jgi:hypothetical protein